MLNNFAKDTLLWHYLVVFAYLIFRIFVYY